MRTLLVLNPAAGGGRAARLLPGVLNRLRAGGAEVQTHQTTSLEGACAAARDAAGEVDAVVAMGGDGTAGACAAGLGQAGGARAALGLIPAGAGNDLARSLGLPHRSPLEAASLLATLPRRRADLGLVGGRHFLDIASAGFDAEVNRVANERLGRAPARLRYAGACVAMLLARRPATFQLTLDGQVTETRAWLVAVSNCRSYGGGMLIAPDALLDDGLFDVVVVSDLSRPAFLATFPKVFSGRHLDNPAVTVHRAARVELAADRPQLVYADGEPAGTLPTDLRVLPGAITVLAPAGAPGLRQPPPA